MKKIIITIAALFMVCGIAYGQTYIEDDDYRDMDKLRNKLVRTKRQMDAIMRDIMATYPYDEKGMATGFGQDVKVDITETDKDMLIKADLPGMDKDKIDITLEKDRILKIEGTRESEAEVKKPGMVRQERNIGRFVRIIELPAEGMSTGIKADYKNGVLEMTIPKKKSVQEETVKIKVQ